MPDNNVPVKNKEQWDAFVRGDLLNWMTLHNLQKVQVDDGCGKKGIIRRGPQGEYKVQITSNETL